MSFQDLHLDVSYESDSNKNQLLDNFYIPVLENSKKYFRIAGFFSSTSLSVAAEGIEGRQIWIHIFLFFEVFLSCGKHQLDTV